MCLRGCLLHAANLFDFKSLGFTLEVKCTEFAIVIFIYLTTFCNISTKSTIVYPC